MIEPKFDNLSIIKNIHKDKRAFIIGTSSSLDEFDWSIIKDDDIVFAVNHAVTALKKCNYFCMTDVSNLECNYFNWGFNICDKIIMCNGFFFDNKAFQDLYDHFIPKTYIFNRRYQDNNNVSFDYDDGLLIDGCDVIHVTAHLAYLMGCAPIHLVGVDLNYNNYNKYCSPSQFKNEIKWSPYTPEIMLRPYLNGLQDVALTMSYNMWAKIKEQNPNIDFKIMSKKSRLKDFYKS